MRQARSSDGCLRCDMRQIALEREREAPATLGALRRGGKA
jgi:hypothetical protein